MRMFVPLAAALVLAGAAAAQEAERFDAVVRKYSDPGQFMGAVLVARGGEPVFSRGYGHANLEWNVPNSPETVFRLGSVTKQFTAACILLLEERGQLRVEDPVSRHIANPPEAWKEITLHHLLTHTSGIPNFTASGEYRSIKLLPATVEKTIGHFRDRPLEFAPGSNMKYSNSGYLVLGHVVERVSGMAFDDFLRENILAPLELRDTGCDLSATVLPRRASGYTPSGKSVRNAEYIDMSLPHAAGAMYSTTLDLLRWQEALFGGKVLAPKSLAKMLTPGRNDYGYGVFVRSRHGHKVIEHGGGIDGFNTMLAHYPERRLTVVVLANLNGGTPGKIAAELAAAALTPPPRPSSPR